MGDLFHLLLKSWRRVGGIFHRNRHDLPPGFSELALDLSSFLEALQVH